MEVVIRPGQCVYVFCDNKTDGRYCTEHNPWPDETCVNCGDGKPLRGFAHGRCTGCVRFYTRTGWDRTGPRKQIVTDRRKRIRDMYADGVSRKKISAEVGCTMNYVHRTIRGDS